MEKKILVFVIAANLGQGKAANSLVLETLSNGNFFINQNFALALGIEEGFSGLVSLTIEKVRAGQTWSNTTTGESGTYSKSFNKIAGATQINNPVLESKFADLSLAAQFQAQSSFLNQPSTIETTAEVVEEGNKELPANAETITLDK
jgi:hypothetical protein